MAESILIKFINHKIHSWEQISYAKTQVTVDFYGRSLNP